MKISRQYKFWILSAASALVLAGCGGDSGSGTGAVAETPPPTSNDVPATSGRIAGIVVASDTGLPLGSVLVQVDGKSVTTAADGSFSQDGIAGKERAVLRFVRDGYADAFATTAVSGGATASVNARMAPISASATYDNSAGTTVKDSITPASVTLPPSSVVDAATGAAPQGAVTIKIAAINPATNPANMPGDYSTSTGANIESFGALSVQLRDAAGKALNLAPGQSATIRIPLASRSGLPPPTIPLFYFNEATGLWVEEGVATLAGVAPNQYYEGSVKHFSTWNADMLWDSIFVNGCVASADGKSMDAVPVMSSGIDYSGTTFIRTTPAGKFRIAIRRNSQASIGAKFPSVSTALLAGPSATDITLPDCLQLLPPGTVVAPVFLVPPTSISAPNGTPASFTAVMTNGGNFSYQWSRNGRPIDGATLSRFLVPAVALTDDQAQFTVTVTNSAGSVTSSAAKLTVTPATPPTELASLIRLLFQSFGMSGMVSAPLNEFTKENEIDQTFWLNPANVCRTGSATGTFNGQPIPVGTLVATGSNRVSGTFNDCASINSRDTLSGTSNISYTLDASLTQFNLTGDISDFRLRSDIGTAEESSLTGNGSAQFTLTKTKANGLTNSLVTFAPSIGSTLRNNLTGQLTQFTGGDSALTDLENAAKKSIESSLEQRNLRFILDGVSYASNGKLSYKTPVDGATTVTGQLSLMRNGFQVGRLSITPEGVFVEINGVAQRF